MFKIEYIMLPHKTYEADNFINRQIKLLTVAVVEVKMVVDEFTRLFKALAGSADHIPSVISVVTVLHLISASAFIFSVWLPLDELARWSYNEIRSQNSIDSCYQMLSARLSKAQAICV
jgi:hypothetical protein